MRKRSRYIIAFATLTIALLVIIVILASNPEKATVPHTLPNGSTVALISAKTGTNAIFVHGNLGERFLYRIVPEKGLLVLGHTFDQPNVGHAMSSEKRGLFLEFKFDKVPNFNVYGNLLWSYALGDGEITEPNTRLAVSGEDGLDFINSFDATPLNSYLYLQPSFYPRQSKTLNIRIEQRTSVEEPWKTTVHFTTQVAPEPEQSWTAEPFPIKRRLGDYEFVLSEVSVRKVSNRYIENSSSHESIFTFRIMKNGITSDVWLLNTFDARDAGGNEASLQLTDPMPMTVDGNTFLPAPDPRKIWRVRMNLQNRSDLLTPVNTLEFFVKPTLK